MTFLPRVRSRLRATSRRSIREEASEISLDTLVLLTLAQFAVSPTGIEFARSANLSATFWSSNAIVLVFLLPSSHDTRNYGLMFRGSGTAIALTNFASDYRAALSAVPTIANIAEVGTAWKLLAIYKNDDSDLTRIHKLYIFMMLAQSIVALGMIIVTPFLLSLKLEEWHARRIQKRSKEAFGLLAPIVTVAVVASFY